MLGAALANRFDTWRSSDKETQLHQAQLQEFVQVATTGGPSLLRRASASAGGRPRSGRTVSGSSRVLGAANDRGFDLKYDYDYDYGYGHDVANDDDNDDEDDGSEGLWLGGWRRRSGSHTSPNASTSAISATASPYQHQRPRSNSNGGRAGITNFSSPYAGMSAEAVQSDYAGGMPDSALDYYHSSVSSLHVGSIAPAPAPAANVAARRSTTSVGSRRSSRVLSAESVRREMGEDA